VVAAIMPSLVLMSRTRAYPFLRIGGALFAGFASLCWIIERLLGVHTSVDSVVNSVAHRGVWIAVGLFLISVVSWRYSQDSPWFHRVVLKQEFLIDAPKPDLG
jgi:hypothetical protein